MNHFITRTTSQKVCVKVTCDSCTNEIKSETYRVDEVSIEHSDGNCYPEGSSGMRYSPDLCSTCFTTKLLPVLRQICPDVEYKEIE